MDYKDKLEKAGFNITIDKFVEKLNISDIKIFNLIRQQEEFSEAEGWIYFCKKYR